MIFENQDVLGDLCFGKPFGMLESDELRGVVDVMAYRTYLFQIVSLTTLLPPAQD